MKSPEESFHDPKSRGEWAEMRFMARAAEEGFRVSKPWGETSRYDFALEANGSFLRIQVKSTVCRSGDGYQCSIQPPADVSQRYTGEQVDFFAAYVIPEDVWYILPAEIVLGLSTRIQLSPNCKKQRYARYKEAWHLLREAVAKKDRDADASPASLEDDSSAPVADPDALPAEMLELRGAVEGSQGVGFDHDLVRRRIAGCFDKILKLQ
jgi:PD-(D/E)XK endonuclease